MQPVAEGDNSSELEIMNKQNQDQHRKNQQQQQEAHEPQKCPRCESTNTKFCYYNNYSLSQPRYFCKTCRRYWTQGGTLRNVPIGGGCRKGKRAKTAASSSSSSLCSSSSSASSPSLHTVQVPPLPKVSDLAIASQYNYDGAAASYLSSFAAIQTSSNQPQPFTRALIDSRSHQELFGVSSASSSSSSASASSAMSLLQGFSDISNSLCTVQRGQVYMTSNPSDPVSLINQSGNFARPNNGPISSSSQQDHWPPQSFNNMISKGASETAVWSIGTGNVRADNTSQSGPSLGPNQWPDLPRSYGSPPP